ncbi:MAG: acetyl-CoA carboxylase biotin carboxyl carrier protein [Nitrospiria bacterium]
MDLKEIKELIALMNDMALAEIEVEESGRRIRVRKEVSSSVAPIPQTHPETAREAASQVEEKGNGQKDVFVRSPIVGTFYKASSPDANAYVGIGDMVKKGQTLCIVEAMKLMNEIESDADGKIIEILIEDGTAVEYGEPLFKIAPA